MCRLKRVAKAREKAGKGRGLPQLLPLLPRPLLHLPLHHPFQSLVMQTRCLLLPPLLLLERNHRPVPHALAGRARQPQQLLRSLSRLQLRLPRL